MTDYWVSQARKFCEYCKCWIADNKGSITFHESGTRHKRAVEQRLSHIRRSSENDLRKADKQKDILRKMEIDAMQDYRSKDLTIGNDLTAKNFNHKFVEAERNVQPGGESETVYSTQLTAIPTKTSGTIWHNQEAETKPATRNPKLWYQAKSDEGHIYYWHIETKESRWDEPPEGYFSIAEQKSVNLMHKKQIKKKKKLQAQSRLIHCQPEQEPEVGPVSKPDPYGGWLSVDAEAERESCLTTDLQLPSKKQTISSGVTIYPECRARFEEKTVASISENSESATDSSSQCAIVFRKRKLNSSTAPRPQ